MSTHDKANRPYAKLSELKAGDLIDLDKGFTCTPPRIRVIVQEDGKGLWFDCRDGHHYLAGQADDGEHCIGVYLANA